MNKISETIAVSPWARLVIDENLQNTLAQWHQKKNPWTKRVLRKIGFSRQQESDQIRSALGLWVVIGPPHSTELEIEKILNCEQQRMVQKSLHGTPLKISSDEADHHTQLKNLLNLPMPAKIIRIFCVGPKTTNMITS